MLFEVDFLVNMDGELVVILLSNIGYSNYKLFVTGSVKTRNFDNLSKRGRS